MITKQYIDSRYNTQNQQNQQKPINTSIRYQNETNNKDKNQIWFASLTNIAQKKKLFLDEKIQDDKKMQEYLQQEIELQNKQQQKDNGFEEEENTEEDLEYVKERYFLQNESICYRCMKIGHQINSCFEPQRCRFCLGDHIKNVCDQNFNSCFNCGQTDHQKATCPHMYSKKCHICGKVNHTALNCTYLQLEGDKLQHLREMDYAKCSKCNLFGHFSCLQDFTQQIPDIRQMNKKHRDRSNSHHQNKKFYRDHSQHRNYRDKQNNHRSKSGNRNHKNNYNKHYRY